MIYKLIWRTIVSASRWMYEFQGLLLSLLCTVLVLFLGGALWYYSPEDSSLLSYRTDGTHITNPLGVVGAHAAALLTYLFGGASFFIVLLLLLFSYMIVFRRSLQYEWDRIAMLVLLLFIISALLAGCRTDPLYSLCPGGFCGIMCWALATRFFDPTAAFLILYSLLLMAGIIVSRFPFITAYYYTITAARFLYSKCYFVRPFYRAVKCAIYFLFYPFMAAGRYVYRLFAGSAVTKTDESIVSFEYGQEAEEDFDGICEDEFWRSYRNDSASSNRAGDFIAHKRTMHGQEDGWSERKRRIAAQHNSIFDKGKKNMSVQENSEPYQLPRPDIFMDQCNIQEDEQVLHELELRAKILEEKLKRFGVCGNVTAIKQGPVVTLFEYQPHIDTKLSKIIALEDDLAMALQALSIRIIAPIPGRSVVGFEVANNKRKNVFLGSVIQSKMFRSYSGALPLIFGCDTVGNEVIVDLAKMPHLLIAGSTGSGKSVALNSMLVSLLCRCSPDDLRLILIDPKRLEFASYVDIAHLLFPIITDSKQAAPSLRWVVKEMGRRYEQMKQVAARNMVDYNVVATKHGLEKLPFIVIIIDELSDLMITAGRDIEDLIVRITQMARAAGIHMLVATQRPSVDVITGLIKVNFPSRVSFRVTSKVDSRTILDCSGAEKLLGRGDMLFLDAGSSIIKRVHGVYVSDGEIERLVSHIRAQGKPEYCELAEEITGAVDLLEGDDKLYQNVINFLDGVDEVSISLLQRRFRIGYNRSARIIDMLEVEGIIASSDGGKMRKVIHDNRDFA